MRYLIFYSGLLLLFGSCVSKSKHASLKQQHEQMLNEKAGLEEALNKMIVKNDSLKKQNIFLDSLFRSEREKNNIAVNRNSGSSSASKVRSASGMSKTSEYDKKALYVYNLPNYIFWPQNVKADKFLIGVIGDSPLNAALGKYMYNKTIHMLPAIVEPYNPSSGKFYHMIFVAESREKDFHKIKKELQDKPVLLITENPYLEKAGAHICLFIDKDKVRFSVSKKAIEKNGLNVSEQLIKLAGTE